MIAPGLHVCQCSDADTRICTRKPDARPSYCRTLGARDLLARAKKHAIVSECGLFRYWLSRKWGDGPTLLFVMLNPSTADAVVDDATIRRCVTFAHAHGFTCIEVVNLFAYRATDPADLKRAGWQIGPENDRHVDSAARNADGICVAWGAVGFDTPADRRVQAVAPLLHAAAFARGIEVQCLQLTRSGFPQHPSRLPSSCRLQRWNPRAIEEAMTR